jgi:alanine racemase
MSHVVVNHKTIASNISQFIDFTDQEIMCVVKSDAYGHGLENIVNTLYSQGIEFFSTYYLEEAIKIKEMLPSVNVLHMGPVFTVEELKLLSQLEIDLMVTSLELLRKINSDADCYQKPLKVHIKLDTGLSRNGIHYSLFDDIKDELFTILENINIDCVGIMSHLMMSNLESEETDAQIHRFEYACSQFIEEEINVRYFHLGNTSYLFHKGDKFSNLVRIGIGTYGLSCGIDYSDFGLTIRPALSFKSEIISSKKIGKGEKISYGGGFISKKEMKTAVVAAGYADGMSRLSSNEAYVLVEGNKCKILGVICMNNFIVDVSTINKTLNIGTEVIIFSDGLNNSPTADDWGVWSDSIGYEVVTKVGNLNKKSMLSNF